MKKLFRFKYEPCNGTCYAWEQVFYDQLKDLDLDRRERLVNAIVEAHDCLCDNPDYYFGLDMCEKSGMFIGTFTQPERMDVTTGIDLEECILDLCKTIINTDIPKTEGVCNFGTRGSENLAERILQAVA